MTAPFSRAAAERLLGPAVVEEIRRQVDAAPPLRPEQRAHMRAVFATASPERGLRPTARAA
ncbi:hypothetical protein [Streptomyces sp. NPDC087437]|uniref:hypothetical protein n=1 Tax=Streptomyces sp. NPDC087437 TaxID=3365789 RepID=UPI003809613E